jgi:fructose/tagatose bisphosphate aldolase
LHGSSGVTADSIVAAIENGICKINVATYLNQAFVQGMREMIGKMPNNPDYRKHLQVSREYVKERVREKIRLFRSNGKVDATGGFVSPKTVHRSVDIGTAE